MNVEIKRRVMCKIKKIKEDLLFMIENAPLVFGAVLWIILVPFVLIVVSVVCFLNT